MFLIFSWNRRTSPISLISMKEKINALQTIGITFDNDESKTTLQFSIFENTKALDPYLWIAK